MIAGINGLDIMGLCLIGGMIMVFILALLAFVWLCIQIITIIVRDIHDLKLIIGDKDYDPDECK